MYNYLVEYISPLFLNNGLYIIIMILPCVENRWCFQFIELEYHNSVVTLLCHPGAELPISFLVQYYLD